MTEITGALLYHLTVNDITALRYFYLSETLSVPSHRNAYTEAYDKVAKCLKGIKYHHSSHIRECSHYYRAVSHKLRYVYHPQK